MILFFFRKILTYFVFALEKKFDIFGAGEELESIPFLIRESAEELYAARNREKEIRENEIHIEQRIAELQNKEETTAGEWTDVSKEISDYVKTLGSRYLASLEEKKKLSDQVSVLMKNLDEIKRGTKK